jgi:type IV secretory pathway VirD2 relaxase
MVFIQVVSDREKLKMDLADCYHQIQFLDELIRSKDQEKDHLMNSYRKILEENERAELGLRLSSEENSNIR